jgi:hypothetical protein
VRDGMNGLGSNGLLQRQPSSGAQYAHRPTRPPRTLRPSTSKRELPHIASIHNHPIAPGHHIREITPPIQHDFLYSRHLLHSARRWASMGFFSRFTSASSALGRRFRHASTLSPFFLTVIIYLTRGSPHKHRNRFHNHLEA